MLCETLTSDTASESLCGDSFFSEVGSNRQQEHVGMLHEAEEAAIRVRTPVIAKETTRDQRA
jgi:hypothetical protein